ncbi:hypothetical protein QJS10_CPA02g00978 [Acorus calamus]|uniref:Uncharacterized protein n=1 Tax=Acorus calamus TaxID=4465 RepID=A0AAV9FH58_ACOCL|nr:hypothetical protein QJS10_CPA02g00978 [Acorus calamus]
MEEDCGRQFQQFDSTEGEGIYNSNQSPDDAQKTPTSQALEKEITELKRTMAAYEIDMLRIMADNNSKSFRLNTGARNIKCLFKKCCSLRRKIRSLNEQIVKLKNLNTKLKNKVSQKEDDIKGYKEREKKMSVIGKQKKIISDMEDDASVHDITQKTALNAEITCLKQQISEKDNIIAQQSVMLDFLQTENPLHEPKPLASHAPDFEYAEVHIRETGYQETKQTRSMVKRIKMKDRKVAKEPDFQYTELGKRARRVTVGAPREMTAKKKSSVSEFRRMGYQWH